MLISTDTTPRRSMGSHQSAQSGDTVWLTPPEILRELGRFDLDPCAAPDPRPWSTAETMWGRDDNSLNRPWFGRVWLNPPFQPRYTIEAFLARMVDHDRGIALLFARTETEMFFRYVWSRATSVLFLRGRPHFHRPDGSRARANSGCPVVLASYGDNGDAETLRDCRLGKWVAL